MAQCLFVLLILTGVLPLILSVPRKYYLIQEGKTWSDAQAYCRATHTDLATIENNDNMLKLQEEAQAHQFSSNAWIGLYNNINHWHWSIGNEPLGSFTSWQASEPNNILADEQCVFIANWEWFDAPCTWMLYFVCFDGTKTGTDRYILISQTKTWFDAQSYCRQTYTDLASARNATENSIVGGKDNNVRAWFGLSRDPWKWSDHTTDVSFIKWSTGDADDYLKNKSCGLISSSLADLAPCSDTMPFFCYEYPKQLQIIRVKVKSSQDVNDPTIMGSILEKIKQNVEDHGLAENITVEWRKWADGVVFHKEKKNNAVAVNNTRGSCDV